MYTYSHKNIINFTTVIYIHMRKESTTIRISPNLKLQLDEVKGNLSYNAYIAKMTSYFLTTGLDPKLSSRDSFSKIEKRLEDIIKIYRVHERDYLKPLLEKNQNETYPYPDKFIRLANENAELKKQIQALGSNPDNLIYEKKYEALRSLIIKIFESNQFDEISNEEVKVKKILIKTLLDKVKEGNVL